ncbi:MAG: Ig-like domain-containing protein [Clostridia bacterium]|nr:Ig-like domain-containing protein [Clostridia bacterium]
MIYQSKGKRKNNRIQLSKILSLILICTILMSSFNSCVAVITTDLPISELKDEFPDSYKPYIETLKKNHPNWVFKAVYTNLDWNLVLKHETYETNPAISLINRNDYGDNWFYNGDNIAHDGPYYTASKAAVAYMLDPRNFLTERGIFQFETLSYSANVHTVESVQKILASTPMGSADYCNKYKYLGEWKTMNETYAEMIVRLSQKYNISPTHVASRIRQENSGDIVNGSLINGDAGVYNFFNIGATPGSDGNSAVTNGLNTAKNNGWTTPEKSIEAGIDTLVSKYIRYGQDTIYFQKFDVNNPYGNASWLFASQYMTNIAAPSNEAKTAYSGYVNSGMIDSAFEFHIPVYNNMPSIASPSPDAVDSRFEEDNTRVYLDDPSDSGVVDEFWIRSSPNSSDNSNIIQIYYEEKDGQENRTKLIRTGKGINTPWDRVQLPDGRIGYVYSKWVYEYQYSNVTGVSLDKTSIELKSGETYKLSATVSPVNAISSDVTWSSSNENIVTVDSDGKIVAKGLGEAIITVTTVNSSKTANCNVKVISTNVESITLDKCEYSVIEGEILTLTPTILPETASNKNYTIHIEDESVLENRDGKLFAQKEGSTFVTFITEDGNKIVKVQVNVIKLNDDDILIDEELNVDHNTNYISNIGPETTVSSLNEKIKTNMEVKYFNKNGIELTNESFVGTGSTVQILRNGNMIKEYTILIYGDVNGDGNISPSDYVKVKNTILGKENLENIFKVAGDVNRDGDISPSDYVKIKNKILGKEDIAQ